jgi:hypothetical protein
MGGARISTNLSKGYALSYSECGQWLNDTEKPSNGVVHGFVHVERSCFYPSETDKAPTQTHKSLAFALSYDDGLTWSMAGQIITGTDLPTAGTITGEGDCTVVNDNRGYYYAYCLRARDWSTIVARAPIGTPLPGNWRKYFLGAWSSPGLGGDATALGNLGMAGALWVDEDNVVLLTPDLAFGGVKMSFSSDKVAFATLYDPIIVLDGNDWARPAPTELMAYLSLMNYADANNQITSPFLLAYVYIPPYGSRNERYLVFRDVYMWLSPSPVSPHVGVALSRWYNAALKDRWSTTGPVPGNYSSYAFEGTFGYLMTRDPLILPAVKLEECVSDWPGPPDHLLTNDGTCIYEGYMRLRTAGWVYRNPQPSTGPVYRCFSQSEKNHFASSQSDCEGKGTAEWLLGYALAH